MGDLDFLNELFEPVGRVHLKRMFGGLGAWRDGRMFAIVIEDVVYLKADETTRPRFEAEGCGPFSFSRKDGRVVALSYWRIPERLIDDTDEFKAWSLEAVDVARRAEAAKVAKGAKQKRRPKAAPQD